MFIMSPLRAPRRPSHSRHSNRTPASLLKVMRTEMSLHVLAYNFKRVLSIVGKGALVEDLSAYGIFFSDNRFTNTINPSYVVCTEHC